MSKDYNKLMKEWLDECKIRYSNDTMEDALSEGRVAIRTFHKDSLNTKLGENLGIQDGEQGLKAMGQKLENPTKYRKSLSSSILPTRPYLATKDRLGVLITLPNQEDIQHYKKFTNKEFIEYFKIDPKLIKEAKEYFTRVSYLHEGDLLAHNKDRHYRPNYEQFESIYKPSEISSKGNALSGLFE